MSDGGFDIDRLIEQRRFESNLFGIVTDPITKQRVIYPSIKQKIVSSSDYHCPNMNVRGAFECHSCPHSSTCKLVSQGFSDICKYKKVTVNSS